MYEMQFDPLPFIAIHCRSLMVLTNPNDAISRLAIMYGHVQAARDFKYGVEPTGSVICSSILIAKCASTWITELLVPSPLKIGHLLVVELPMDAVHPSSLSTPSTTFTAAPAMPSVLVLSGLLSGFNTHAHMSITSSTSTTTFAPAHQSLPVLQPARPITAFTGLPRPTTASVQEQRRASIQRNLHGNRPSASASSSTTSSPSRRKSGPPRPFSNPAPALASLDDFGTPAAPTEATLTVGILPKVLDTSVHNNSLDPSPRYQWKGGADIEQVQRALKKANLTCTVEVSTTGPIFEAIDAGFRDHCRRHNLDFLDSPDSVSDSPNTKPWVLLGPKGRAESRTWVEDPKSLTQFTFTLRSLQQLPFSYTPNNLGEGPFVFIAVRFRNLYGPIDCLFDPPQRLPNHVLTHKCLGRRVLRPILASLAGDPNPTCRPLCTPQSETVGVTAAHLTVGVAAARPTSPDADVYMPTDSDDDEYTEFPGADTLVDEGTSWFAAALLDLNFAAPAITLSTVAENRTTQAPSSEATAAIASVSPTVSATAPFVAGPLLTAAMEMTPTSRKPRSFVGDGPMDLTLKHMPGSGANSLSAWQIHIQSAVPPIQDPPAHLTITARSIDEGARVLIMHCLWLFAGRPSGLKSKELLDEQFPSPRPAIDGPLRSEVALFGLQVEIASGIGRGPRNEIIGEAIKILMADGHYWTEREGYQTLRLHPSRSPIPATGFLFLLHFIFIGAPYPASPLLFSTLFDGRQIASKFDVTFLSAFVSPHSLSLMKKIHRVPLDTRLYASQSSDCVEFQYMLNIPDFDPTMISSRRSQEEHDGVCASIVSFVTLGSVDIENHSDFGLLADGFNVVVNPFDDQDRPHHILEQIDVLANSAVYLPLAVHAPPLFTDSGTAPSLDHMKDQFTFNPGSSADWPTEVPQYYPYAGDFDSRGFTPATIQNLLEESQNFIDSYDITSSPSLALGTFSTAQFSSPVHPSQSHLHLHSPSPRRPLGSTFSSNSSLNLVPAFDNMSCDRVTRQCGYRITRGVPWRPLITA
ncbi:hypothetical protein C8F04DRAFT_1239564 [Mycena alexandri]|uniref:Uncharacterized protein n=1 Tax=Mycena alexandri TaxID=1745969 RepID=A0AAD6SBA6_9AGAR|nr:hypothetical protein C8F04DRAFT_1239564 [Mycena alexandri]